MMSQRRRRFGFSFCQINGFSYYDSYTVWVLWSCSYLYLLTTSILAVKGEDGELCVVSPFPRTPYIIPYEETKDPCNGCLVALSESHILEGKADSFSKVHILRAEKPESGVVEIAISFLNEAKHGQKYAFVLSSGKSAVNFVFSFNGPLKSLEQTNIQFLATGDCEVTIQNVLNYTIERKPSWAFENLLSISADHFGFISSFTQSHQANRISFVLDANSPENSKCDLNTSSLSPIANCTKALKQEFSGCFHESMIGVYERDIHIIEVDGVQNENDSLLLLINGRNFAFHKESKESLYGKKLTLANGEQNERMTLQRNLTLVLLSHKPTKWTLKVTNIEGTISFLVGGQIQVENTSSSGPNLLIAVNEIELPSGFDKLILEVLTTIGTPISYSRLKNPKIIRLFVPLKHDETNQHMTPETPNMYANSASEKASSLIREFVSVSCDASEAHVFLPIRIIERVGEVTMFFADRSCLPTHNHTHIILSAKFDKCGFLRQVRDDKELFTNFVYIEIGNLLLPHTTDDEDDYEGSAYGEVEPTNTKLPVILVKCEKPISSNSQNAMNGNHVYRLAIFQGPGFKRPLTDFPIVASFDDEIYAKITFTPDKAYNSLHSGVLLLIEECLMSNAESNSVILIRKSCPVQPYVTMNLEKSKGEIGFHFQIPPEYSAHEKVYLYCQVGICSDGILPKASIKKCVDPDSYCRKETLVDIFANQVIASLLQTVIAGPFVKKVSNSVLSGSGIFGQKNLPSRLSGNIDASHPIIIKGLSTQLVVIIAVCAFIIGIILMGALWIIYIKTDPSRQQRSEQSVPRPCTYDMAGNSGSSTPSQAPMTA